MNLCKDCRWLVKHWAMPDHLLRCKHPNFERNPVSGDPQEFASIARGMSGDCGHDAALFEPIAIPPLAPVVRPWWRFWS